MTNTPSNKPKLCVILGPTASGKSSLGLTLAQQFSGEIVSADSRQVYCGLDIGTAKVTPTERSLVPHHLLDVADAKSIFTVSQFREQAINAINAILARSHQPFLVGGSPHYIQMVVDNTTIPQVPPQPDLRVQLEAQPLSNLLAQLATLDPLSAQTIDHSNPRRVIRALEVCLITGKPFSAQRGTNNPLYDSLLLGIHWPRHILYQRIDDRIDSRVQQGLLEEIHSVLKQGLTHERLEGLGLEYRFGSRFLRGEFSSEAEMIEKLKFASHDFARRQLSWFRKETRILWLDGGPYLTEQATTYVSRFLQ